MCLVSLKTIKMPSELPVLASGFFLFVVILGTTSWRRSDFRNVRV